MSDQRQIDGEQIVRNVLVNAMRCNIFDGFVHGMLQGELIIAEIYLYADTKAAVAAVDAHFANMRRGEAA